MPDSCSCELTVLVPCYNVEKFIGQCLDSISRQTFSNFEVICINDGSTDGTLDIIERFCDLDLRFRVVDKPNSGYGDSMNIGLAQAKGEFIAIIESDDYIESTMFEDLLRQARKYDLDIVRSGFYYTFSDVEKIEPFTYIQKHIVLKPLNNREIFYQPPAIWASIYRKAFLEANDIKFLPTPGASFQDTSFAFKCYLKCNRFMSIQGCYVHYRQHDNNSVRSDGKLYSVCDEWDEIIRYAQKDKNFKKIKQLIGELFNNTYRWNYNRLTESGRRSFIKRWSEDWKKCEDLGISLPSGVGKRRYIEQKVVKYAPFAYALLARVSAFLKKVGV